MTTLTAGSFLVGIATLDRVQHTEHLTKSSSFGEKLIFYSLAAEDVVGAACLFWSPRVVEQLLQNPENMKVTHWLVLAGAAAKLTEIVLRFRGDLRTKPAKAPKFNYVRSTDALTISLKDFLTSIKQGWNNQGPSDYRECLVKGNKYQYYQCPDKDSPFTPDCSRCEFCQKTFERLIEEASDLARKNGGNLEILTLDTTTAKCSAMALSLKNLHSRPNTVVTVVQNGQKGGFSTIKCET